jgi:hypothetical protein
MRRLFLLLCAPFLSAQSPQHAVAIINDPRSHGQLGDNLLSLNEAILLHNRQLTTNQLSAAEQQQISFIGGDIAMADIDTSVVSTVTLERDLDPVLNMPHGLNVRSSPTIGTIDIGNTNGFIVDSDFCDFRRLVIRGGAIAIRVAQRDTFYGSTFENVRFEGQTTCSVQVYLAQNDGETFLRFEDCTFVNIPTGVRIDDLASNRRGEISLRGCLFDGGNEGFVVNLGPGGNRYNCRLDRSTFQNQTAAGLVLRRVSALADRGVVLDLFDMVSHNVPIGVWVEGHATALTDAIVRMADLSGTAAAMYLGGSGTNTKITVHDAMFTGPLALAGRTTLVLDNVRHSNGALAVDAAPGTTVNITQSAFSNVAATVAGGSAATFDTCRFDNVSMAGTATAPVTVRNSYSATLALGANATATGSIPNAQLGLTRIQRQQVAVGQTVDIDHDLPPGFFGIWMFGFGVDDPTPVSGLRVYIAPGGLLFFPGVWRGQGRLPFPIPPVTALRGLNVVLQMIVGHDLGIRGPQMQLPPGGRVLLR